MRSLAILLLVVAVATAALPGQQPGPPYPVDSTRADTARPAPPTPAQERYLWGLRTASRGIAQLKNGVNRVARAQALKDSLQLRQAGQRLAGLCVAARGFLTSGRGDMAPAAYEPPTRASAKDLAQRIDSLAAYSVTCEHAAGKTPAPVTVGLLARIRTYEGALAAFRTAVGLPNR